jgi:hypothetical protein
LGILIGLPSITLKRHKLESRSKQLNKVQAYHNVA